MSPRRSFQAVLSRLFVFAFALSVLLAVQPAAGEAPASPAVLDKFVYLPGVFKPGEIYGTVTWVTNLVAGVQLELRFFDGVTWSTRATATTDGNGRYAFTVPTLNPGQRYYARYTNTSDPLRLGYWATKELAAYSALVGASFATFDIAAIALAAPANDAELNLPIQFNWFVRAASPNDNYEFALWEPIDDVVYYTGPLGYVNGYTLSSAPWVGQWYGWSTGVFNNGEYAITDAYGLSFSFRWVYIRSNGMAANQAVVQEDVPLAQMLPELIDPATDRPIRHLDRSIP